MLSLVLVIVALVLFALAALGVSVSPRLNLVAGGLFFWLLSTLV